MTGSHAFLAPSSAFRWGPGRCPGSAGMESHYPDEEESEDAIEGTAAHWVASEALYGRAVPIDAVQPGAFLPTDQDMIDCAGDYVRDVRDTLAAAGPDAVLAIETKITGYAGIHALNYGTPDATIINGRTRKLHVWDYKYGRRYVDIFENWQLLDYAALTLFEYHVPRHEWPLWSISLTVFQPRNFHPSGPMREWFIDGSQLSRYANMLTEAALLAAALDAPLKTGEHCRDCAARRACPALQRAAMSAVDFAFEALPVNMPADALGLELAILSQAALRLKARITGLEEQAKALLKSGATVPHWRTDYSYGRERWAAPVEEVILLGDALGVDLRKPPAVLTPKQAEKAGVDRAVIEVYSEAPRGAMALLPFEQSDISKRFS